MKNDFSVNNYTEININLSERKEDSTIGNQITIQGIMTTLIGFRYLLVLEALKMYNNISAAAQQLGVTITGLLF